MKDKVTTTLGLMSVFMLVAVAQSYGQVVHQAAPIQPAKQPVHLLDGAKTSDPAFADTTLRYYDRTFPRGAIFNVNLEADGAGTFDIPAVGTFFEAPFNGTVDRVDFELSNFDTFPGVAGTGTLRVKMIPSADIIDPSSPGVDSVDVDFADLGAQGGISPGNFTNQIDVTGKSFDIVEGEEYFMQLSLVNASPDAAVTVVFDGGSSDTTDTRYFPARTFAYLDSLAADAAGAYLTLRDPTDTSFVHLNLLLELRLTEDVIVPPETALVQFVHNRLNVDSVDVFVGDALIAEKLAYQEATPFLDVLAGEQEVRIVNSATSEELVASTERFVTDSLYWATVVGAVVAVQPSSGNVGGTKFTMTHGALGLGTLNVRFLDSDLEELTAFDLEIGEFSEEIFFKPGDVFNVELTTGSTLINIYRLNTTPTTGSQLATTSGLIGGDPAFTFLTVSLDGTVGMLPINTAVETHGVPGGYALHGNYPNPFNPSTAIRFDLKAPGFTTLKVYNLLGREVATVVAEHLPGGSHEMVFDASGLPSGPYFYRLASGRFSQQKMLMLIK